MQRAYVPSSAGPELEGVVSVGPPHCERRTAVVWPGAALAGSADDRDASECGLGHRAQRSLVSDFRSACRAATRARLCATRACRVYLSGWQKPWLEPGGEPD